MSKETKDISEEELKSIIYSLLNNKYKEHISVAWSMLLTDSKEFRKYYIIVRLKDCYRLYHRPDSILPDTSGYKSTHHIEEDNIIKYLKKRINQIEENKGELVNVEEVPEDNNEMLNNIEFLQTLSQEEINVLKKTQGKTGFSSRTE